MNLTSRRLYINALALEVKKSLYHSVKSLHRAQSFFRKFITCLEEPINQMNPVHILFL
jgi:hypothetical protein